MATVDRERFSDVLARQVATANQNEGPSVNYVARGDYLTVFFNDEAYFSERIDDLLTIYRSVETKSLIGCKIKGVSILVQNVASMIDIEDDELSVNLLLLNAAGPRHAEDFYYRVGERARTLKLTFPFKQILGSAAA